MTWLRPRLTVTLTVGTLLAATAATLPPLFDAHAARADETTLSENNLRDGWDANEPGLTPGQVGSSSFGRLHDVNLRGGQIYAQPVVAGGTVVVATENNNLYGIDAATGGFTWQRFLGQRPQPSSAIPNCGDLAPNIGVTGTPAYDPATGTAYLVDKSNDTGNTRNPHFYVHAFDAATGKERSGWPVKVGGAPVNAPSRPFSAYTELQRPGLLFMNGSVYAAFGGNCDHQPYNGYVLGVNATTRRQTLWTDEATSARGEGGIWMSGGGLVSDGSGRILLSSGNGIVPSVGPGKPASRTLGDAVVRLGVNSDGTLGARDFFSPSNSAALNRKDADFGSGGPAALPDTYFGTTSFPHLLVQEGKDGRVFLLNRDALGGYSTTTNRVVTTFGHYTGQWGHPGVWGGDGGYIYLTQRNAPVVALKAGSSAGRPTLSQAGTTPISFGYSSGSPVVTSDGATSGSAVLWVVYAGGSNGSGGTLYAYNAVPVGGRLQQIASFPIGTATKFATPATDGGRVFIGTRDGHLIVFGQ